MAEEGNPPKDDATIERAFGAENRNRLIDQYFGSPGQASISPSNAWEHVYRRLLWSDPTTGLAHCYESDKCQPGKAWYARSLAFHDWLCDALKAEPSNVAQDIDWLFIKVCSDLAAVMLRRQARLAEAADRQRLPYQGREFPEPGADPELNAIIRDGLAAHLPADPPPDTWHVVAQNVRQYLAVQNKRKNLVGEGFEDVLSQIVRRACHASTDEVVTRRLLYEIPGFNRARHGTKENKVDLAIVRPTLRTIVTAKWSVRADREKQFPAEYEEYCNAESEGKTFDYVFVTNEFDPARLMRACEVLFRNSLMFNHVVHINTDGLRAAYGQLPESEGRSSVSRRRVIEHIDNGRLISLERWLDLLAKH